jgi:hypothetical protein
MAGDLVTTILSSTCNVQFWTPSYWYVYRGTTLKNLKAILIDPPTKKELENIGSFSTFSCSFCGSKSWSEAQKNKLRIWAGRAGQGNAEGARNSIC